MKMALGLNDSRRMWATGKVVAFNVLHGCEPVRMDGIVPAHKPTHPKAPVSNFNHFGTFDPPRNRTQSNQQKSLLQISFK